MKVYSFFFLLFFVIVWTFFLKGNDQGEGEGLSLVCDAELITGLDEILHLLGKIGAGGLLQDRGELHVQGLSSNGETGLLHLARREDEQ